MERRLRSASSTQDSAAGLPVGSVVVAGLQTEGRGRLGRRWEAPAGTALLVSFVLPPNPLASLAAGLAAAEACGGAVRLKWPNDLMLEGRKLGGILVETRSEKAIVGFGINLTWAPAGAAFLGSDRETLLARLRITIGEAWALPPAALLERWRALSETLGRRVRVSLPDGFVEGMAEGLAEDGALIVSGRRVAAGDVIHLWPAAGPAAAPRRSVPG
jgi:BirA family transcriptional regulator, biotin operon repressor / biotin---[acetyl-CoA-carboxylase] ligase